MKALEGSIASKNYHFNLPYNMCIMDVKKIFGDDFLNLISSFKKCVIMHKKYRCLCLAPTNVSHAV